MTRYYTLLCSVSSLSTHVLFCFLLAFLLSTCLFSMHTSEDFERSAGPQGQRRQLVLVLDMVNVLERLHVWGSHA
ncbi:hypothetical protein J3E72DRAFT_356660 [Bipolaris maydis]|uniref:uncharacterized protein n=1 Tax=Cochliobolus heterostrophus TaxID=5016 RepID=UPI0024DD4FBC|nr:hypothetical protein J3E73DRAFT_342129 [Bipolaris maydis]KAJ5064575.1 hypothetical protein J3E74DRAFT_313498 [Bipolaris maydis]KAJ6193412.1 hypothetical protein J3E72DRAFT_356660 [Bipolaris maydis]KAJ6205182.1 hypothetical protein PSV09DRAFT_2342104 [Bipolaris maydis]KAJ6267995.1 hypothetical protein PSV08DRAFT_323837 [Bipolaris maydis]